jgi:DNA-binding NarL/FixJ family response regulator
MEPIRIGFVDDHPTLLAGIATIFADLPSFRIVGQGASADEALRIAEAENPDVMVLDLSMPGDVFSVIAAMTGRTPPARVVIFTAYANVEMALRALDAGAHGYVLKGQPAEELVEAIHSVLRGELFVSPDFAPKVMSGFRNRSKRERELRAARLSTRELQIVEALLQGHSNKEIARSLQLSEKTIKHYMTNLMNKLKVKSRLEVVLAAQALEAESRLSDGPEASGPEPTGRGVSGLPRPSAPAR